jgi:hypothetical protein
MEHVALAKTTFKFLNKILPLNIVYFYIKAISIFKLLALDGATQVGNIAKEYSGLLKEWCSVADNFRVKCNRLVQNIHTFYFVHNYLYF